MKGETMAQYEFTDQYPRKQNDLYIDEPWCSERLFEKVIFQGPIHDPACGTGNIVKAAHAAGYGLSTANDLVDRGFRAKVYTNEPFEQDYLKDTKTYFNIVTNPPYNLDDEFIEHALRYTKYKVAVLVRLAFLAGQARYKKLYSKTPPTTVLVFSKRPSMPPPGVPVGGGKTDFCW